MNGSERVSGVSLSKELTSLAEFRAHATEKLGVIERLVAGTNSAVAGTGQPGPRLAQDPTLRYTIMYDPAITKLCLQLLVLSDCPLTIGKMCMEVQSMMNLVEVSEDQLRMVSESLSQLSRLALAIPVERLGVRKWTWAGGKSAKKTEAVSKKGRLDRNRRPQKRIAARHSNEADVVGTTPVPRGRRTIRRGTEPLLNAQRVSPKS